MEELYDNADVLTMISAFRNPSQFGVLSEDAPTDKEPFATAVAWLEKSKKVGSKNIDVISSTESISHL